MNNNIPVIKFLFQADHKALNEALKLNPGFQVEDFLTANDLVTYLSTVPGGLVITSLRDKNDLVQIATFMKLAKKLAKDTVTKFVVINFSGDRNFEKAIAKLGLLDLVEPTINTKAFKFKLDFLMKSLMAQTRMSGKPGDKHIKGAENGRTEKKLDPNTPIWIDALTLEDDIWILKNELDCKKLLGKWLIRLMGPSPYSGTWIELKPGLWRFDLKPSQKELFISSEGSWYFAGDQKPDFVWKENSWLISGDSFDLFFKTSKKITSRLKSRDKFLTICKNSLYARTKEQVILDSFDQELVFKKEVENLEDLEGKNKTDQLKQGNLQGKTETPAERTGHLTGKTDGTDKIVHENLEEATRTTKETKHWSGRNGSSEEPSGNNETRSEQARKSESLDLATDLDHQKYYKNHNEAKKFDGLLESGQKGRDSGEVASYQHEKNNSPVKSETEKSYGSESENRSKAYEREQRENEQKEIAEIEQLEKRAREEASANKPSLEGSRDNSSKGRGGLPEDIYGKEKKSKGSLDFERGPQDRIGQSSKEEGKENLQDPIQHLPLKGTADTEKLSSHYGARKNSKPSGETEAQDDEYAKLFEGVNENVVAKADDFGAAKKTDDDEPEFLNTAKPKKSTSDAKTPSVKLAEILSLNKARQERTKESSEQAMVENGLDELTQDSKVTCFLLVKGKKLSCDLNDFFDDTIIFHVKKTNIDVSSVIGLDMSFKFLDRDKKLTMLGTVLSVDDDGEGSCFATVQLSKENTDAFDAFMRLYETRQSHVSQFLRKVKGL